MKPHPKIRKTIKWGGAAVTVLFLVAWSFTIWWRAGWTAKSGMYSGSLFSGELVVSWSNIQSPDPQRQVWTLETQSPPGLSGWWFDRWHDGHGNEWYEMILVPLWFPVVCGLLVTTFACRLDTLARRRVRLNLCPKCTYDRTGLSKDAVCPECGAAVGPLNPGGTDAFGAQTRP